MSSAWLMTTLVLAADAPAVLAETDAAMNRAKDLTIQWTVADMAPGGKAPRALGFQVRVKGPKSLTSFDAPADLKGTRVLVLARDQMWVWLPSYGKVRRIASHVTEQGFMGTSYSHADMNGSRFGDAYTAASMTETGDAWVVQLDAKPDAHAPYPQIEMTVAKSNHLPTRIAYQTAEGKTIKVETRSDYACQAAVCLPGVMRMEDLTRPGAWTELRRATWVADTGLSDDVFSVRTLQMGL